MNTYEYNLQTHTNNLQNCQQEKQGKLSCLDCDALLDCEVRNRYVKAVFEDMTQGSLQDFDF